MTVLVSCCWWQSYFSLPYIYQLYIYQLYIYQSYIRKQPMKDRFLNGLNTALMLNLFFVLFCFGWFAIALVGRSTSVNLGFDLWYSLWEPVIMPSIGILMAGALVSGISSWVSKKFLKGTEAS